MKKIFSLLCVCSLFLATAGCEGGGEATSVTEDAEQSAIEAYQAAEAAEQKAMDESMKMDIGAEPAKAAEPAEGK